MLNGKNVVDNNSAELSLSENEPVSKKLKLPKGEEDSPASSNPPIKSRYHQMEQSEDYYKFLSLFKEIDTSERTMKEIVLLDGELVDPKSIKALGHGGSKITFSFGNGSHVFFIQNTSVDRINPMLWKRIISEEIAASKEIAEIGLPTQTYKHGSLSIKDPHADIFYSIDILISKSFEFRSKENLVVYDCKNNEWFGQRPFLYQGSFANLKDPAWNKGLLQDFATEIAIALAFKAPLDEDTLNFSIEKSTSENTPPKLHIMLYDFSSKSSQLPFPVLSKNPTIPSMSDVKSNIYCNLGLFITDEEKNKLTLKYKHEVRFLIPNVDEISELALTNVKREFVKRSKVQLENYKVKSHEAEEHLWYGFNLAFKSEDLTLIKEYLKILSPNSIFVVLAQNGNLEAVRFMLQTYNQEIDSASKGEALCAAAANSHTAIEKLLLEKCRDAISLTYKCQLFYTKVKQGKFEDVQAILEEYDQGIDSEIKGKALCTASCYSYTPIVKLLLERCKNDIPPNYKGEALLSIVWSETIEHLNICKLILTQCDDIPLVPRLYIHLAAIEIGETYSEIRELSKKIASESKDAVKSISRDEFIRMKKQYHSVNRLHIDTMRRGELSWVYNDKKNKVNDTINALNSDLKEIKTKTLCIAFETSSKNTVSLTQLISTDNSTLEKSISKDDHSHHMSFS
ncbi:MAG: hypothetical protein HYX61_08450 [Gammaproteobacteria bacterium]|nr:hypothetical protein [Gammaproteobacteria bacterium]